MEQEDTMDGLPREKINMVKNLKYMIISQLQARFGPCGRMNIPYGPSLTIAKFDILSIKIGNVYTARAIVYGQNDGTPINPHEHWTPVWDGRSEEGFLNALEDLWNQAQNLYNDRFLQYKKEKEEKFYVDPEF